MSSPSCTPSDLRVESLDTSTITNEGRPKIPQQQGQNTVEESEKARIVGASNEAEDQAVYLAELAERRKMRGSNTASTVDIARPKLQAKPHYRVDCEEFKFPQAYYRPMFARE